MITPCTCSRLRQLTRKMTSIYDRHLAEHDISIGQFSLLVKISRAGTIGFIPLAELMGMDKSTLSRTLKPMIQSGWIKTEEPTPDSPFDKRSFTVQLTEKGEEKRAQCRPAWLKAQRQVDSILGREQHQLLFSVLDQANKNLDEADDADND